MSEPNEVEHPPAGDDFWGVVKKVAFMLALLCARVPSRSTPIHGLFTMTPRRFDSEVRGTSLLTSGTIQHLGPLATLRHGDGDTDEVLRLSHLARTFRDIFSKLSSAQIALAYHRAWEANETLQRALANYRAACEAAVKEDGFPDGTDCSVDKDTDKVTAILPPTPQAEKK